MIGQVALDLLSPGLPVNSQPPGKPRGQQTTKKIIGHLPPGSTFEVLDAVHYAAGKCNPKTGQWLKIRAMLAGIYATGWIIGRYTSPL